MIYYNYLFGKNWVIKTIMGMRGTMKENYLEKQLRRICSYNYFRGSTHLLGEKLNIVLSLSH